MLTTTRRLVPIIPILAGIAVGSVLALVAQTPAGGRLWSVTFVILLPFFLAAMTGVAKTTTA